MQFFSVTLNWFIEYLPQVCSIVLAILFIFAQIPYLKLAAKYSSGAAGLFRGILDAASITFRGPALVSIATFVCYEIFVIAYGSDMALLFMFAAYYVLPAATIIYYIIHIKKLYTSSGDVSISSVANTKFAFVFVIIIIVLLFVLITCVVNLPFSVITFSLPFLSVIGLSLFNKKR